MPKVAAGPMTGDWTMTDANGQLYTLYQFDTPLRSATSGKRLAANQALSGNLDYDTAMVFAWQGFFLPDRERRDRLVLTYGYRRDTAKSANLDTDSTAIDFSGLYPVLWDAQYGGYGPPSGTSTATPASSGGGSGESPPSATTRPRLTSTSACRGTTGTTRGCRSGSG